MVCVTRVRLFSSFQTFVQGMCIYLTLPCLSPGDISDGTVWTRIFQSTKSLRNFYAS